MIRIWPPRCAGTGSAMSSRSPAPIGLPTGLGIPRADQIAAGLPKQAWQRVSAGCGAQGYRYCDWAFIILP